MTATVEKTGSYVSLNGQKETKQFGFYELLGLKKAFYAIEISNPKRPAKVDYWLNKNEAILGEAWEKYIQQETELIQEHAETFSHPDLTTKDKKEVKFIVYQGKDETDTLLNDNGAFFRKEEKDGKPLLEFIPNPSWDLEIPSEEEGKEHTIQKMKYNIKFISAEAKEGFDEKLSKLQNTFSVPLELWKLSSDNLEGLNVMWKGRDEDLTQFRNLIYDNAIV